MKSQVQPSEIRALLCERAKALPSQPGVYLMKNTEAQVLYVGKAKSLKNRVSSYFQQALHPHPRTEWMVGLVDHFEVIFTETEDEALILECTLIKKYKPKYNIRLKDDKNYPYLKIDLQSPAPRIQWTRRVLRDGARYFGPFPSATSAREVMVLLNETFRLRDCSDNTFRHRSRPCMLHQIGRCTAPCVGLISQQDYQHAVHQAVDALEGKSDRLEKFLRKEMLHASDSEDFERAVALRDQLRNLEIVTATQGVLAPGKEEQHRDVIAIARKEQNAHASILQIRGGRLIGVRHFQLQHTDASQSDPEIIIEFLEQYFDLVYGFEESDLPENAKKSGRKNKKNVEREVTAAQVHRPRELLIPAFPPEFKFQEDPFELLERTLGVKIRSPESAAENQLIQVAQTNADHAIEAHQKRVGAHSLRALEEVADKLSMDRLPHRIECYDISNLQGSDTVASRVVFIDGAPEKELYRRYNLGIEDGVPVAENIQNDFLNMKRVLTRRFEGAEAGDLPDLLVVDGGKGQLAQAVAILEEIGLQGITVAGLAKARTDSDFRASDVESSHERVFLPGRKNPIHLLPRMESYKLLTHIRDEAHRFAISYHRLLRSKRVIKRES